MKGNAAAMKELPKKVQEVLKNMLKEYHTKKWYFEQHPDGLLYQEEDSHYTAIRGEQVVRSWQPMGEWSIHASEDPLENSTNSEIKFEPGYFVIEHRIYGGHIFTVRHVGVPALAQPQPQQPAKPVWTDRGFTRVITDLEAIENDVNEKDHKVRIMASALHWGYASARTNYLLEQRLYRLQDMRALVKELADQWDGEGYMNGALYVANRYYTEKLY